jgi:hypothetical protein
MPIRVEKRGLNASRYLGSPANQEKKMAAKKKATKKTSAKRKTTAKRSSKKR